MLAAPHIAQAVIVLSLAAQPIGFKLNSVTPDVGPKCHTEEEQQNLFGSYLPLCDVAVPSDEYLLPKSDSLHDGAIKLEPMEEDEAAPPQPAPRPPVTQHVAPMPLKPAAITPKIPAPAEPMTDKELESQRRREAVARGLLHIIDSTFNAIGSAVDAVMDIAAKMELEREAREARAKAQLNAPAFHPPPPKPKLDGPQEPLDTPPKPDRGLRIIPSESGFARL